MKHNIYLRKVNYYETDKMGIVHHSNHIRYFEEARIFFMRNIDCDVAELEKLGVIIPNVDAYAKYLKPIKFDNEIEIEVNLSRFTGAVMEYQYTARLKDSDEVVATGHTAHCFVGADFKPISIKRAFPDYYGRLKENTSKL